MKNKSLSTSLCKSEEKSLSKWDEAINEAKRRISELKRSIKAFEQFKASGVPFPDDGAVRQEQEAR
ncbi:MAG TPA: hypothetical protein VJ866_02030 [Pyrinomonadaceae bacterium]|nr:hypothetical protein [Pyrinomonadaceae bacterium]